MDELDTADRLEGDAVEARSAKLTHLTPDEIVAASLKKGARGRTDHLSLMQTSRERYGVATTGNPYYVAFTVEIDGT